MTTTLNIIGYEPDCHCEHCGRKLQHGVRTDALGVIGADCLNNLTAPRSYQGKPYRLPATNIRELAMRRERYSMEGLRRFNLTERHFAFQLV